MDTSSGYYRCNLELAVRFKIENIQPSAVLKLDNIYNKYREKSIHEFADEEGISISKVQELVERNRVYLQCHPDDVVDFLSEISKVLENDELKLFGPIVFTDELQVTMSRYLAKQHSRDEFMQDIFELLNSLVNRQGNFGMIIAMPTSTETLINDVRPDIQQRFQYCNLFIRPNTLYERNFPMELWQKFSEVYSFEDIAFDILSPDTIDSIGQIAFRDDLGAGPRTVIEFIRFGIDCYDEKNLALSPIDLMDGYLDGRSRMILQENYIALNEVLQSAHVQDINKGDQVVKLLAAYPLGCVDESLSERIRFG